MQPAVHQGLVRCTELLRVLCKLASGLNQAAAIEFRAVSKQLVSSSWCGNGSRSRNGHAGFTVSIGSSTRRRSRRHC